MFLYSINMNKVTLKLRYLLNLYTQFKILINLQKWFIYLSKYVRDGILSQITNISPQGEIYIAILFYKTIK